MANKEEALETSPELCLNNKILVCFLDNRQHQQSRAKHKHSRAIVAVKEHLSDSYQESGLKLKAALRMFRPLLLVSSVFVICYLLVSVLLFRQEEKIYGGI